MNLRNMKKHETFLSAAATDEFSLCVQEFLQEKKLPRKDIMRYCLMIEEILLKTMDAGMENVPIRLITGERFLHSYITLEIDGKEANVFVSHEDSQTHYGSQILKNLGVSPDYRFSGETNIYSFHLRRKNVNPFLSLLIALSCAAAVGFLGLLMPDGTRLAVLDNILTPLHNTFLNMLSSIAGPMIFLAVARGIYGIGDVATLKRVGKKVLLGYIRTVAVVVVIFGALCVPFFSFAFSQNSSGSTELSTVFSMLLDIIPKNIFSPFVDGNTLQIIFLAAVVGISLIFLGHRTNSVARAIEQINYIVQFLIEFISRLVPYFLFIVVVRMIWSDMFSTLANLGKYFIIFVVCSICMTVSVVIFTAVRNRVNPLLLVKKGLPTFLIAVTTASSAATFGTNVQACNKKYGIDELISSFGIPLALATFKPCTALCYTTMMFFFAEIYHIDVSPAWIVMALFVCIVLSLATPPIPGGAMSAYTVLLTQLGLPMEALAIALACDAIIDFITTGFNQFLLPFPLITQAGKLGLLDYDTLRKK